MEKFYEYVLENYTLSAEAKRMLDNIVQWCDSHFATDINTIDCDGVAFLEDILSSAIGITVEEIEKNWR